MNNPKQKKYSGFGVGSTSVIMIFIVLCLTTFSILSYISSNAGYKFAKKSSEHLSMYYSAQNSAEMTLRNIDNALYLGNKDSANYSAYVYGLQNISGVKVVKNTDSYSVSYSTKIDDNQTISVELKVPLSPDKQRYSIIKWANTTTVSDFNSGKQNIWNGN